MSFVALSMSRYFLFLPAVGDKAAEGWQKEILADPQALQTARLRMAYAILSVLITRLNVLLRRLPLAA